MDPFGLIGADDMDGGLLDHVDDGGAGLLDAHDLSGHDVHFGAEGRYPHGTDSDGDTIAQGSLGPPYKLATGEPVNPNDVKW
jgi:hypothetical protein